MAVVAQPATLTPAGCAVTEPLLDSAVIRVRVRDSSGPLTADASVPLDFAGRDPAIAAGGTGPFTLRTLPFQRIFVEDSALVTRLSWAPDGERIVFSDGTRLLTWRVGAGSPVAVPHTNDGVSPAWSPDGQWIAFTRIQRGDSIRVACNVIVGVNTVRHDRTGFSEVRRVLVLIRPDGSGARELTVGEEPAWSPDGESIYFVDTSRIFRIPITTGEAIEVPGTEFAREPAVSPDGLRIAVARSADGSSIYDLWSIPLAR
jgi:WD40 repeat protein